MGAQCSKVTEKSRRLTVANSVDGWDHEDEEGINILGQGFTNCGARFGNWELEGEELGRGKYGVVVKVKDRRTGNEIALKTLQKDQITNIEAVQTEVLIHSKLHHPNILKLLDSLEDRTHVYLSTELCQGGELYHRIAKKNEENDQGPGCFTEGFAAFLIAQILTGIAYLHEKGIIHRDLKPENFLLSDHSDYPQLKICDFGFAVKEPPEGIKLRERVGTPYYCAPEVLAQCYDRRCDLWSAGCTAYVLLCGRPPFDGPDGPAQLRAVRAAKLRFPRAWGWERVSAQGCRFVRRLLARDPGRRPSARAALRAPFLRRARAYAPEGWGSWEGGAALPPAAAPPAAAGAGAAGGCCREPATGGAGGGEGGARPGTGGGAGGLSPVGSEERSSWSSSWFSLRASQGEEEGGGAVGAAGRTPAPWQEGQQRLLLEDDGNEEKLGGENDGVSTWQEAAEEDRPAQNTTGSMPLLMTPRRAPPQRPRRQTGAANGLDLSSSSSNDKQSSCSSWYSLRTSTGERGCDSSSRHDTNDTNTPLSSLQQHMKNNNVTTKNAQQRQPQSWEGRQYHHLITNSQDDEEEEQIAAEAVGCKLS